MKDVKITNEKQRLDEAYKPLLKRKKRLTKLEEEKQQKKIEAQESEVLAVEGQESEKQGRKWVSESVKTEDFKKKSQKDREREFLYKKRRYSDQEYMTALGAILHHRLKTTDAPIGYSFRVEVEGKNVLAIIKDRFNREFKRGFTATGEIQYDYKAILVLESSAQETVDYYEEDENRKTKGGLYLPPTWKN